MGEGERVDEIEGEVEDDDDLRACGNERRVTIIIYK